MQLKTFDEIIARTLDDVHFSRSEKKAVRAVVETIDPARLPMLRSRIYAAARGAVEQHEPGLVIDWMEGILKALIPVIPPQVQCSAHFSPGEDCRDRIIGLLRTATRSLDICVFTITDNAIAKEIYAASIRHVAVRVISDNDKSWDRGSDVGDLAETGIPLRIDHTEAHMHHKFMIVDGESLLTGSYNWTRSAFIKNQENVVVIKDDGLVRDFKREFERLWKKFG